MCTRTDIEDRKRAEGGLQWAHDKIKTLKPPSRISRDYLSIMSNSVFPCGISGWSASNVWRRMTSIPIDFGLHPTRGEVGSGTIPVPIFDSHLDDDPKESSMASS